jgi:hypothetical protein
LIRLDIHRGIGLVAFPKGLACSLDAVFRDMAGNPTPDKRDSSNTSANYNQHKESKDYHNFYEFHIYSFIALFKTTAILPFGVVFRSSPPQMKRFDEPQ